MMMAKNREEYTQRCVSSRLREKACVCKRAFWQLFVFLCDWTVPDESHYIFSLSFRSFSREKKSAQNALKRANERVDLQKQNIRRLLSPFITIRGVLVVVRASEKKEHVGYIEESIQERILTSSRF